MQRRPVLTRADHDRLTTAIRQAEAGTAGEVYVVVTHVAEGYRLVPVLWAALLALLIPWPLHLLTAWGLDTILTVQAAAFLAAVLVLSVEKVGSRLVPPSLRAEAVRRTAQQVFLAHGVHLTRERTGVLVFASLADRRVEVLADEGIHALVPPGTWDAVVADVTRAGRAGALADGLVAAVERLGALLAHHVPPHPGERNDLSDRAVEI